MKSTKKYWKGFLAMALALINVSTLILGSGAVVALSDKSDVLIYDLSVNDLVYPIGIDDANPTFSWKLQSDTQGQKQTAYQLVVATDEALTAPVWDTGKVESNDTTDIVYAGATLADCTQYYWQVRIWDKDGVMYTSETKGFETAFIQGDPLSGADWIEMGNVTAAWNGDFVISADVVSMTKAFSLMIGGANGKTNDQTFLWIVEDKDWYFRLQTYLWQNNKWVQYGDNTRITPDADAYAAMKDGFMWEIKVADDGVYTYVDGELVATRKKSVLNNTVPSLGYIGIREATGEGVVLDSFAVTDYTADVNGSTLLYYDFNTVPLTCTNQYSTVANGQFVAVSDASVNNNWYGEDTLAKNLTPFAVQYVAEADVVSIQRAMGLLLGGTGGKANDQTFMWLIEDKSGSYTLGAYLLKNNKWTPCGSVVTIASGAAYTAMKDGFNLKIKVAADGVYTFVDDVQVAKMSLETLGILPSMGYFGVRAATNEGFVLDSFSVTDYTVGLRGNKVVAYDFNEKPAAMTNQYSTVADGKFTAMSDAAVNNNWYGEDALAKNVTSFVPQFAYEMDVVSLTKAFGLLYGAAARTNNETCFWLVEDKGSYYHLQTYLWVSGKWSKCGGDIRLSADANAYAAMKDGFTLKVTVAQDAVYTYVDGSLAAVTSKETLGMLPKIGFVGVREATGEGVVLDNFRVIDYTANTAGEDLVKYDFSTKPTILTNQYSVVENGVFSAISDAAVNNNWYGEEMFAAGMKTAGARVENVHYSFTSDISCTKGGVSLMFAGESNADFLAWRFILKDDGVVLQPSKLAAGKWTRVAEIDLSASLTAATFASGCTISLDVTAAEVKTYVNGKPVNTFALSALGAAGVLGKFGFCIESGDLFTYQNLVATDYTAKPSEATLFEYDCAYFNPTYRGKIVDGKVKVDAAVASGVAAIHSGTDTFRKEFTAQKQIEKARLYIASTGVFNAYINGERVGNPDGKGGIVYEELTPGWTYIPERTCYTTYDVTSYLANGNNAIAVGVNHGWSGIQKNHMSNEPSEAMKLRTQLVITYTDGSVETIVTDDSWRAAYTGPILASDIYQGEYYDASEDVSFRYHEFDDRYWANTVAVSYPTPLAARIGGQIYVREDLEREPQSITVYDGATDAIDGTQYGKINVVATYGDESFTLKKGQTAVIDFGQNFAGWENLSLSGAKGTAVRILHGEILNDQMGLISRGNDGAEGSVHITNLRDAAAQTVFVLSGGNDTCRPTTTYYGFRYLSITADADITISKARGEVVTSILEDTGTFTSSDARVNQLFSNVVWTQYSNFFGLATDCPQRSERYGYGGDALMFIDAAVYNADVKAFLKNFMLAAREAQAPDGGYSSYFPNKETSGSVWAGVAGYGDAGILIPYSYYKQYGDITLIEDMYDSMAAYMDYLAAAGAERIGQKFGDWLSYVNDDTMINYVSYVYTIWDAQAMQEMAAALGKAEDVAKWEAMEATHKAYYRAKFLDENGELTLPHQTAHLFAVKLGVYETEEEIARGKENLIASIRNNGTKLNTGLYGTSILMETLMEIGETELAYELLYQDADPSWLYLVDNGATTIWERWNSYTAENGIYQNDMNSFNHHAFGIISQFLYDTVLGISAAEDGYSKILLAPVPTEKMTFANGSYDSANGLIESAWELDANGRYAYAFTVPMNTTATVKLEKQAFAGEYYVNGVAASAATLAENGAEFVKEEDGFVYFEVVSGKFTFACDPIPVMTAQKPANSDQFQFSVAGIAEYNGGYTANENKNWYAFTSADTDITDAIAQNFNMYYNRESVYVERADATATDLDDVDTYAGSTSGASRWILLYNQYFQRQTTKTSGEKMRKIDSLVPLNAYGEEIVVKNFEATFDARFENDTIGAVLLGFRQQVPGKFVDGLWSLNKEQAFVAIGRDGINIAGGTQITSDRNAADKDMYNTWQTDTFAELLPQEVTVKVRAVGTTCEVWIYKIDTTEQLKYYTVEIPYEKVGTIAYGVSAVGHDIGDFNLIALDENGEKTDLLSTDANGVLSYRNGEVTVTNVEKTDNGYKYTLQVAAKDGYELKAGSLIVTDDNGYAYVPTRVGFRQGGDAAQYVVETTGGGILSAEFVAPTADNINVGCLGSSINEEKSGLRFIHRVNVAKEGDKLYMTVDGAKRQVAKYGLLVAAQAVLQNPERLTLKVAAESMHVHQIDWPVANKYFDTCDTYSDISVQVTGIAAANAQNVNFITRVFVEFADGTVAYGDVAVTSYAQTADGLA